MLFFLTELHKKNSFLVWTGWFMWVVLIGILLFLFPFENEQVLGINLWIKPIKFLISSAIYLWTFAFVLDNLKLYKPLRVTRYGFWLSFSMFIEVALIIYQASRGVKSHFNISSSFDIIIFNIMGAFILINTVVLILICIDFFRLKTNINSAFLWSIRLGIILILLASFEAGFMLKINAHTVGAKDGGEGLVFLNWSTKFGDLRVAHFVGMHAIQILPLIAFSLKKFEIPETRKLNILFIVAGFILGILIFTLWQALEGYPLIRI
jgi:hypothetical protein